MSCDNCLTNARLTLRALEPADLDTLYAWENDAAEWDTTNTYVPYSREQLRNYIANYHADLYRDGELRLMATLTAGGQPVGALQFYDFSPRDNRAQMGLFIDRAHRGQGYGALLAQMACALAGRHLGLRQLYAVVATGNQASISAFTAAGFTAAGTLLKWFRRGGAYRDALVLQHLF